MVAPGPSFAAALVAGLRRHGTRPAAPGGAGWAVVADEARLLALGFDAVGVAPGARIRVADPRLGPVDRLARELAVLASGRVVAADEVSGHDAVLTVDALDGGGEARSVDDLRGAGRTAAERAPDAHEVALAALSPEAPALVAHGAVATHAQLQWAMRSVAAWLGPPLGGGPTTVVAAAPDAGDEPPGLALLTRWYPAGCGAALVDHRHIGGVEAAVRRHRPDLLVADAAGWRTFADAVRGSARSRRAALALRSGRATAAGEPEGRAAVALGRAARARARTRLVGDTGLGDLRAGVSIGSLGPVDASDLDAAGVAVASTWIDPAVPGPIAASTFTGPDPAWGRPLPGRTIEVGTDTVVRGGDVGPDGAILDRRARIDGRGRVRLDGAR